MDDRARPGEGLAGEIGGEGVAPLEVLVPPRPDIGAEHALEGGLAAPYRVQEVRPGQPILLDHDRDLVGEARRRIAAERGPERPQREGAVVALSADALRDEPAQEALEVGRRDLQRQGQVLGGPGPFAHLVGEAKFRRGIGERRGVISLDLAPQPVFFGAHAAGFACAGPSAQGPRGFDIFH
jgi:hypothetical protein